MSECLRKQPGLCFNARHQIVNMLLSPSVPIPSGMEPGPTADPYLSHPGPTDLRFSELGSREVQLHWTNPTKPVRQHRVVYHSAEGQTPQEVRTPPPLLSIITSSGLYILHRMQIWGEMWLIAKGKHKTKEQKEKGKKNVWSRTGREYKHILINTQFTY